MTLYMTRESSLMSLGSFDQKLPVLRSAPLPLLRRVISESLAISSCTQQKDILQPTSHSPARAAANVRYERSRILTASPTGHETPPLYLFQSSTSPFQHKRRFKTHLPFPDLRSRFHQHTTYRLRPGALYPNRPNRPRATGKYRCMLEHVEVSFKAGK